ncbi:bifunctional 3-oxoadipate enol-lactonase/4-carboxymuconolactone decarboxylase PcaDC [Streptacidiphilus cavernicola]|uniref:4-carboxymuconolactone decarboxylase n=1 Tax=Streptacidiphilus cavernicola TaxID=3342716 RepID=A0ABV6VWE2_9ACTN
MTLHHRIDGPLDAAPLLLGPSLGTSLRVWDGLVPALARSRRVIRWDLPGHGGTPASVLPDPAPGRTTVADLGGLVLALADQLGVERFDYAGISLGGAVGTWLALHHPDRVCSLAVVCSSARFGDPAAWRDRATAVRADGLDALADTAPTRWFTVGAAPGSGGGFAGTPLGAALVQDHRTADPVGYAACCDALAGFDLRDELSKIQTNSLVVAGRQDLATPPAHARELADGIPGAALVEIPTAAHLAPAEKPEQVLAALLTHLDGPGGSSRTTAAATTGTGTGTTAADGHAAGTAVRRAVLGDAHVDRAVASASGFTAPFQDLITRYAWGEIWTRPGLDRRTRSCITLTALVARGHLDELALHVRAARRNGLSPEEIGEVLLQSAIYCGVPAANSAFAVADRVLAEEGTNR